MGGKLWLNEVTVTIQLINSVEREPREELVSSPEARVYYGIISGVCRRKCSKSKRFIRSPIAGAFEGTYGLAEGTMLGRLSLLLDDNGFNFPLASINFRIEP